MSLLISGGAGFVGSNLAKLWRKEFPNQRILVLDNLKRRGSELNIPTFKKLGIEFVHGDIRNRADLMSIDGTFDLFIEASAEPSVHAGTDGSADYLIDTNLMGTINCLEFARQKAKNLIFLSTSRVYSIPALKEISLRNAKDRFEIGECNQDGLSKEGISEEFCTQKVKSLYGATKLCSEMIALEYAFQYDINIVINRCGVIAGAGQFGKVDQGVFTLWVANHFFNLPLNYMGFGGEGLQVRDLLHPRDLFNLIKKQQESLDEVSGETFNIGGGIPISTSLKEYTNHCRNVTGRETEIGKNLKTAAVDIPFYATDYRKAQSAFDWQPKITPMEIVEDIHSWIKSNENDLKPIFCN